MEFLNIFLGNIPKFVKMIDLADVLIRGIAGSDMSEPKITQHCKHETVKLGQHGQQESRVSSSCSCQICIYSGF